MSECTERTRFVCLGRRFTNEKMHMVFAEAGGDTQRATHWPLNKRTRHYQIGGIYEVGVSPERDRANFSASAYEDHVGEHEDTKTVAAWRIADEAAGASERRFKNNAKGREAEKVVEVLEPLRTLYRTADKVNRRLIELTLLDYLRR